MNCFLVVRYLYKFTSFIVSYLYLFYFFISVLLKVVLIALSQVQTLSILQFLFLKKYYHRNELLWVDGFFLDFLQKKSVDIWLRRLVIYTGFLFSERLVFDYVVRFYLDNILWPLHERSILEVSNVTEMLSTVIFFYFFIFSILVLFIFVVI